MEMDAALIKKQVPSFMTISGQSKEDNDDDVIKQLLMCMF